MTVDPVPVPPREDGEPERGPTPAERISRALGVTPAAPAAPDPELDPDVATA